MSSRLLFFFSILMALLMILLIDRNEAPDKLPSARTVPLPEYIAVDPVTVQYDSTGAINHHFRGSLFTHYPEKGTTEVLDPEIVLYREKSHPWQVNSKKGLIYNNGETVVLEGSVAIRQQGENSTTELLSEQLTLTPADKYAQTDKPVIINTALSHTEATGMRAWLDREYIELLSKVTGHHAFQP